MSTILNINDISKIIPQRHNLLMVDRAEIIDDNKIIGLKNATSNEPHFIGHFPNNPIMPGILQFEIMLQLANILHAHSNPQAEFLFPKHINKVRFKSPIRPGEQIIAEVSLEQKDDIYEVKAVLKSNGKVCSQGNFTITKASTQCYDRKSLVTENALDLPTEIKLNSSDIDQILPHRYPFNFVDHIILMEEERIVGKKLISYNENHTLKYKDIYHIPHSHIIEAAAQVACVKLLSDPNNVGKIALFLSVEKCEIKKFAIPGDELIFDVKPLFFKTNLGRCAVEIYIGKEKIMCLEIAFGLVEQEL